MRRILVLVSAALAILVASGGKCAQSTTVGTDFVEVNGARLHYRVGGDGPPLLLLHGFTGAGAWWDPYLEHLAENYTTIVPDLPGHGRSEVGPNPYRFDEVAADIYALMDELGIDRFRAVGYSGGGIVLIHMAIQQTDRIESMALVSAPHVLSRSTIVGFPPFEEHPAQVREYWLRVHPGGEAQVRRLITSFHHLEENVKEIAVLPEALSTIEARTLIVLGDRDPLFGVDLALEMYQAIPSAALWIVPMEGHWAIWPDWGGSAEAASIFPAVVPRFLGFDPYPTRR
jgi:pimeloyl-ACP methyl ester carboxylesterase